jgi:hypothetical protein
LLADVSGGGRWFGFVIDLGARVWKRNEKGKEVDARVFIEEGYVREGLGLGRQHGIDGQGGCRAWAGRRPEEEGDLDRWGPPVGGRERGQRTDSGFPPGWAVGQIRGWAKPFPRGLFLFLYSFSFSFSFF